MAIWRKKNLSRTNEEEETKTRAQSPKSNSCLTHSHKEQGGEEEGKMKGNEEEVSLKSPKIPDLNEPYDEKEENSTGGEIVLPTKRSSCMIRSADNETQAATLNVHKYKTYIPPKLIVMGCKACYMYVMVPEKDQRCPKCHLSTYLVDVCPEVHANKRRLI